MSPGTMVVHGHNRVIIAFHQATNGVGGPFLHFGIGSLYGIQFYGSSKFPGIRTGYGGASHPDPIIIAPQDHYFIACLGLILLGLIGFSVTDAPCLHDHLVEAQFTVLWMIAFVMLKSEYGARDQGL